MEAEAITGIEVKDLEDGKRAALALAELGPEAVVVKGGHIIQREGMTVDILLQTDEFTLLEAERHETKDTHGTGCSFSSAIAAELAKGRSIKDAADVAKKLVNQAIRHGLRIGKGHGPLNPMAALYNDAEKHSVLKNLKNAVSILEGSPEMRELEPEVQINIGMALPYPVDRNDVAAIDGRITKHVDGVKAAGCPGFGVSSHVARTILAVMEHDPKMRAGMNMRYSEEIVDVCESMGLETSYYDRRDEPREIKEEEGKTTYWGASEAVNRIGGTPDVIYHYGDFGKEPMVTLLGVDAVYVAEKAVSIAKRLTSPI